MTIETIQNILGRELPGKRAHTLMAPRPLHPESGKHDGPPVNSAVLLLLIEDRGEWIIPFIQRASAGRYHGGQIALPGGKVEPEDEDTCHTALRECHEEIGVKPEEVTVLGRLSDVYIPFSNYNITPFIGTVAKIPNFVLSSDEVEKVILVSLTDLFNDENKTSYSFHRDEQKITAPGYKIGRYFVWGATAMIVAELETLLKQGITIVGI